MTFSFGKIILIPLAGPEGANSSLGNQLFQLAFGLFIKQELNEDVRFYIRHDSSRKILKSHIDSKSQIISSLITSEKLISTRLSMELFLRFALRIHRLSFNESSTRPGTAKPLDRLPGQFLAEGYFQNYKFADVVKDDLISRLKNSEFFNSAFGAQKHQIAVHIRFGDYYSNPSNSAIYGVINADYYIKAIKVLSEKLGIVDVCLISDEPKLALSMLDEGLRKIPGITVRLNQGSISEDFCTIARSKASVIGNSTFAWWASWLGHNTHSANVVYPTPWFADVSLKSSGLAYPTWIPMNRTIS